MLDKPIDDNVYVYGLLTGDHVAAYFSICNGIETPKIQIQIQVSIIKFVKERDTGLCLHEIFLNLSSKLTVDQLELASKELLTCQFCSQGQAGESPPVTASSRVHEAQLELLGHYLDQQHQQHICLGLRNKKLIILKKAHGNYLGFFLLQYDEFEKDD